MIFKSFSKRLSRGSKGFNKYCGKLDVSAWHMLPNPPLITLEWWCRHQFSLTMAFASYTTVSHIETGYLGLEINDNIPVRRYWPANVMELAYLSFFGPYCPRDVKR